MWLSIKERGCFCFSFVAEKLTKNIQAAIQGLSELSLRQKYVLSYTIP